MIIASAIHKWEYKKIMLKQQEISWEKYWILLAEQMSLHDSGAVYGVKTTGIYCRFGCSSKRPNQENVVFFSSANKAQSHSYRACMKCLSGDKGCEGEQIR